MSNRKDATEDQRYHRKWRIPIKTNKKKPSNLIPGFQAVKEALKQDQSIIKEIWISENKRSSRIQEIISLAEHNSLPIKFKKASDFDQFLPNLAHQGIIAFTTEFQYIDLEQLIQHSQNDSSQALLVVADHITDEGNLGALIRTTAFFGAHGLVLPKDRSAQVTERVRKRSSGAYLHLPTSRVVNLGRALDTLNDKGFWIIGAAGESTRSIYQCDWNRDVVLVLGREDKGITNAVRKRCHEVVCIPGFGALNSLNVSIAGGIIISEIVRQRFHHPNSN